MSIKMGRCFKRKGKRLANFPIFQATYGVKWPDSSLTHGRYEKKHLELTQVLE